MRDLSFFSSGTNVRTDVIHAAKPRYRGLAARHASKIVNVNVNKLCCLWLTSPLWAYRMFTYDVCAHVHT